MRTTRTRVAAAAVAVSLAAAGAVALATTAQAAPATYQVTPKTGPGGDNNNGGSGQPASAAKVVTIAGTKFRSATNVALADGVKWATTVAGCAAGTTVTNFTVPTATKVVATIPANELALGTKVVNSVTTFVKKDYVLCVFDGATLLGTGKYSVFPTPTITTAVAPTSGTVSGGGSITVEGTGFTSTSAVKFGSVAATQVKVAADGTSLTAKVPAATAAADDVQVSVTTEGGTTADTANDNYDYVNAVSVSPSTGTGALNDTITVSGVGFNSLTAASRVYLSDAGAFDATTNVPTIAIAPANYQVVSDTQLVVKLPAVATDMAYTVLVVRDPAVTATASVVSSSATYTVAEF
jgi:hypothetical protein